MTPVEAAFMARLQRRASLLAPDLALRYLEAYRLIRGTLNERELADAIRRGHVDRLIARLMDEGSLDPHLQKLRLALDEAVIQVARREAQRLPSFLRPPAFDILNPRIVEAAREFDVSLTRQLSEEVRESFRAAVVRGIEEGVNPRTTAREAKRAIGLTAEQNRWVANFRVELETGDRRALGRALGRGVITRPDGSTIVRRGHAAGEGLTKAQLKRLDRILGTEDLSAKQIDTMTDAYRKRLEAWNTESHARTAALQAQKIGARQSWEDAIRRGVVRRTDLVREWLAVGGPTGDGRNRAEHLALHGTRVGFDERYPNGQLVPGEDDYNCRCVERIILLRTARRRAA